jgi:demethylmenaquinone methyltransferase/2-methoxy-6-polyprenyl-1,4-benzoquinol methylase
MVSLCARNHSAGAIPDSVEFMEASKTAVAPTAPHRPLGEFYSEPSKRGRYVNDLFDEAAPDYDWISGVMSFWTDRFYRRLALRRAGLRPGMKLLDVASGTGLMVKAALELGLDPAHVTGIDPSRGMLDRNRHRNPVRLLQARGECLPLGNETFDFVSMGYALRHTEDLCNLFAELRRVLRPGGRLLILEITKPASPFALFMMRIYMQKVLRWLAWLRRRNQATARLVEYYWATIAECVPPQVILSALQSQGFRDVRRTTTGPLLSDYAAVR